MLYRQRRGLLLIAVAFLGNATTASATSIEQREYQILVEGKEVGQSNMTITRQDDGTTVMKGDASVRISKGIINFSFSNESTEWWKDGRLIGLKAVTTENKRKTELTVSADNNRLRLWVNNKEKPVQQDPWVNSYWKLPDAKYHNKRVPVLEVDAGREHNALLKFVGTENMAIAGQQEKCYHFKLTGGPNAVDLWFDQYYLLVRQEFVEQGHRTVVQIKSVKR
ncbi:MAG: hypothetical protein FJ271_23320 [Planctomycetes bacterium]|nr:hypothetical protein [Planctomycetota bacterium]